MKIIKLFSFIMLISLSWLACKDTAHVKVTAENTDPNAMDTTVSGNNTVVAMDDAMQTSRTELGKTISELQATINAKIAEGEKELQTASKDAQVQINVRLDELRKERAALENLTRRVGEATADTWADLEREAAQMTATIKEALNK